MEINVRYCCDDGDGDDDDNGCSGRYQAEHNQNDSVGYKKSGIKNVHQVTSFRR